MAEPRDIGVQIICNGSVVRARVQPRTLLVEFIRDTARLTGTHIGCDTSYCGACTVLLNGDAVKSCTVLAVQADGQTVTTVEGLEDSGHLHPLQMEFSRNHALQCGFCTPGFLMAACALLRSSPNPDERQIRKSLGGNTCRCTGYLPIVRAVEAAARRIKEKAK